MGGFGCDTEIVVQVCRASRGTFSRNSLKCAPRVRFEMQCRISGVLQYETTFADSFSLTRHLKQGGHMCKALPRLGLFNTTIHKVIQLNRSLKAMTVPVDIPRVTVSSEVHHNFMKHNFDKMENVPLWSVEDVASWVKRIGFNAQPFIEAGVDGDILLQIDDKNLQQDLDIKNGIHRKRFLRELNSLKKNADYSCMDRGNIAHFLAHNVGPDYKCYAYAFLKNDLTLELLLRLNEVDLNDMLHEAGVISAIHKRKIIEAILERQSEEEDYSNTSSSSPHSSSFQTDQVDVFVSYPKQHGAAELASLVKMQLQLRGFSVYSDAQDSVSSNHENVLNYVREAKNFVLILTPNALDDCIGDLDMKSYLHREIVTAIKNGCNIIPVLQDFQFPDTEELPENMRALCYFNGVRWIHDYQDACIDKLERFIRGESFLKTDPRSMTRSTTRSRGDSGRSTPTTQVYTPLTFRKERCRTISIDSAIGSAASAF